MGRVSVWRNVGCWDAGIVCPRHRDVYYEAADIRLDMYASYFRHESFSTRVKSGNK